MEILTVEGRRKMDLIAQGELPEQRWRRSVPENQPFAIGRSEPGWSAYWDDHVSRKHVDVVLRDGRLVVDKIVTARNPLFLQGKEVAHLSLEVGEHFVIGGTTFTLTNSQAVVTIDQPLPLTQQQFKAEFLREMRYRDAETRIDALGRLPDLIQGAASDRELFSRIVNVLLSGVPRCQYAAIVDAGPRERAEDVQILHWDCSGQSHDDFRPSERLIRQAVRERETVMHVWNEPQHPSGNYTQSNEMDWAFCTPVSGTACQGWALYVAGRFLWSGATPASDHIDFRDDLKFAESTAAMLGNLREVKLLERGHAALSQFFSPVVLDLLAVEDPEIVLAPREATISVMFFDLRGFSLHAEYSADDLFGLLDRVSAALGVMTKLILRHGGVVGDFQGDSVMGFWGWPLPQDDAPLLACQTALAIQRELALAQRDPEHPLAGFGFGIGLATGRAVAGKIGTVDQVKVTVFGPVVNLASRLEGMTKIWRAPVLLDDVTAKRVGPLLRLDQGRIRQLAVVQPYGLTHSVAVSELLLTAEEYPAVTHQQLKRSEACLQAIQAGDWQRARETAVCLSDDDPISKVIRDIIEHQSAIPAWDGVIRMQAK